MGRKLRSSQTLPNQLVFLASNPLYIDMQTELNWGMRAVLIDWLVQVHERFQLVTETYFSASISLTGFWRLNTSRCRNYN